MANRVQHIVLFQFPQPLEPDVEREMIARIREWPSAIGGFTRIRFGRDTSGRSRGYQYALLTEFENEERMQAYFPHPVHEAFRDWVHAHGSQELAFDYPVNDETVIFDGS